jgi:hypothetical protein
VTEIPDFLVAFWWVATVFTSAVALYVGYRFWRLRKLTDGWAEENAELRHILDVQARNVRHSCYPPAWSPKMVGVDDWVPVEIGTHYQCMCGVEYVLTRRFRPRPGGPYRLGWVTTTEARTGARPPWDRQPPENRLEGPPPQPPGRHRTAAL